MLETGEMENLEGKWVSVNGLNTRYVVMGSGYPLILVHGFGEFLEVWWLNIGPLSEHYRVYALDLPGQGLSDKPDTDCTIPFITGFMSGFMQALGIECAHFVGHSLGAGIGLNMAIHCPERVNRLVLVDSGGLSTDMSFLYRLCTLPIVGEILVRPTIKAGLRHGIKRAFYNPDLVTDEMVDKNYELMRMPGTKQAMLNMLRANADFTGPHPGVVVTDKLHLVKSPVLFIHGEQDPVVPLADVRNACKMVPNAELAVFAECGHCPYIEKAAEFNEVVIAFLDAE